MTPKIIFALALVGAACSGGGSTAPTPVSAVSVSPASATLTVGQQLQLAAVTVDSRGGTLTGRAIVWSSSNPTAVAVTSGGLVSAVAEGSAEIVATSEGRSGRTTVTSGYPYPNVSGEYNLTATFDGVPPESASVRGTLSLTQPIRLTGRITGTSSIVATVSGIPYTFLNFSAASVTTTGEVRISILDSSGSWVFTGQAIGNVISGRHLLTTPNGSVGGPWSATRVGMSAARAALTASAVPDPTPERERAVLLQLMRKVSSR